MFQIDEIYNLNNINQRGQDREYEKFREIFDPLKFPRKWQDSEGGRRNIRKAVVLGRLIVPLGTKIYID